MAKRSADKILGTIKKKIGDTVDETLIESNWPSLAKRLEWSQHRYDEFHPPLVGPAVSQRELRDAISHSHPDPLMDFAIAQSRAKEEFLRKHNPRRK